MTCISVCARPGTGTRGVLRFVGARLLLVTARILRATPFVLLAAACLSCAQTAGADDRDFPFTYEWFQNSKGEREVAYHLGYDRRDNSYKHELEFEYGVTKRLSVAPYVVFKNGDGRGLHFDAVKLETRYQLGEFKTNRVLVGLYGEIEQAEREALELEGKLILSHYDRHGGNLSFNYILHRQFATDEKLEHSYSVGYARGITKGLRGGVEWIHELNSGRINAGPVLSFDLGRIHVATGYAFPLNSKEGNREEVRLLAEFHF